MCLVHYLILEFVIEVMHSCFGNSKVDSISERLIFIWFLFDTKVIFGKSSQGIMQSCSFCGLRKR
jgi:hypothetical protein